ncbi:MAG: 50S ribosomal protein L10 [Christensenellaceae bacterium]|nr:50S ribosomal protein L10 [Christensenellaceae bacterium]
MAVKSKVTGANFLKRSGQVKEIEEFFTNAKSAVFVNYKGLNVAEDTIMRSKMRGEEVSYKVYKNNLVRIALNNLGINELDDKLTGSLAIAFSNKDEISGAKIIAGENFKGKMNFEFGLLGKTVLQKQDVIRLAAIPSRETLIAQLMGLLQSGARGIAGVVNAVPRNLAVVIKAGKK